MICHSQSNRGPLKEEEKELKYGSLPTADIVGAVGKIGQRIYLRVRKFASYDKLLGSIQEGYIGRDLVSINK